MTQPVIANSTDNVVRLASCRTESSLDVTPPAKKIKKRDKNPTKTISSPGSSFVRKVAPSIQPVLSYLHKLGVNREIKKCLEEEIVFSCFPRISDNPDFQIIRVWASEQKCAGDNPPCIAPIRTKENGILHVQNV